VADAIPSLPELNPADAMTPLRRVIATFVSPSRAFEGARLKNSWWLPFLLLVVISATIGSKVGWDAVARNAIAGSPKQAAKFDQLPAEQQQAQISVAAKFTGTLSYVGFVVGPLIFAAIVAGVLLVSLNFMLGGHASFGSLYSLYFFTALPSAIKILLATGLLLLGAGTDTFQIKNPVGSNPAYYMAGSSVSPVVLAIASWVDVFLIWQIVLLVIGCAVVAKVSRGKAAAVVGSWVFLGVLISAAFAAI
jgi:hypothetical protein